MAGIRSSLTKKPAESADPARAGLFRGAQALVGDVLDLRLHRRVLAQQAAEIRLAQFQKLAEAKRDHIRVAGAPGDQRELAEEIAAAELDVAGRDRQTHGTRG